MLLAFLPYAANYPVTDEVGDALVLLALRDGKPEPAILKAVGDAAAVRRAAAAAALLRAGAKQLLPRLKPLLKDPDPQVRLRVALALIDYKDNDAVAPLVEAVGHLTPEELATAEEVLLRLAGKDAPKVVLGSDADGRKTAAQAWGEWWQKARGGVDLAKIDWDKTQVGYTLVVRQTLSRIVNNVRVPPHVQVLELDQHGKPRWTIELPLNVMAVDAQVIGPNRVLITEYSAVRITERDFRGNVKWEKTVPNNPVSARRLPNGHTFVVMNNGVVEYDRQGKEVFRHDRMNSDCFRGAKLPSGEALLITQQGQVLRIDPKTNQVVKTFNLGSNLGARFGCVDVLPNGNLLVNLYQNNKIAEFDRDGNKKWEATVLQPFSVQRLPNGHTLVASNQYNAQGRRPIVELDANGQQVGVIELDNTSMLYAAQRR